MICGIKNHKKGKRGNKEEGGMQDVQKHHNVTKKKKFKSYSSRLIRESQRITERQ